MKELKVKSKRLVLIPMIKEEGADGCIQEPESRNWNTSWKIMLRDSDVVIGNMGFNGSENEHCVEIGYIIENQYEGNGYATEAVKTLTEWLLAKDEIYFVEAEIEADNKAAQRVLEKSGFVPDGEGQMGQRYVKERAEGYWMPMYMCFGMSIGMALGNLFDNMAIGMCFGMSIGMAIGAAMDATLKKKRKKLREERNRKK